MVNGVCPKCGREAEADAVICGGCDYILDASFLGDDITDVESEQRPGIGGEFIPPPSYGDALILGDLDDEEVGSFATQDTGMVTAGVTHARIYVGAAMQQLLNPRAIPEPVKMDLNQSLKFTPFERHIMEFVNGRNSVGEILKRAGLDENAFFTAMATLADKGFLKLSQDSQTGDAEESGFADGTNIIEKVSLQDQDVFSSSREQLSYFDSLLSKERTPSSKIADAEPEVEVSKSQRSRPPLPAEIDPIDELPEFGAETSNNFEQVFSSINDLEPANLAYFENETEKAPPESTAAFEDLESFDADFDEGPGDDFDDPTGAFEHDDDVNSLPTAPPQKPVTMEAEELSLLPLEPASAPAQEMEFIPLESMEGDAFTSLPGISEEDDVISISMEAIIESEPQAPTGPVPLAQVDLKSISKEELQEPAQLQVAEEEVVPEVPYAQRRKAEKLFEDAEKDAAEGRMSSALMNAKLSLLHNPHYKEAKAAIATWSAAGKPRNAKAERERILVDEAQAAEARGDYMQALDCLDRAIKISPREGALHNLRGVILATRLKRFNEASEALMKAVELSPVNTTFKNNLGKILAKQDDANQQQKQSGGFFSKKPVKHEKIVVKKMRPKII